MRHRHLVQPGDCLGRGGEQSRATGLDVGLVADIERHPVRSLRTFLSGLQEGGELSTVLTLERWL